MGKMAFRAIFAIFVILALPIAILTSVVEEVIEVIDSDTNGTRNGMNCDKFYNLSAQLN